MRLSHAGADSSNVTDGKPAATPTAVNRKFWGNLGNFTRKSPVGKGPEVKALTSTQDKVSFQDSDTHTVSSLAPVVLAQEYV